MRVQSHAKVWAEKRMPPCRGIQHQHTLFASGTATAGRTSNGKRCLSRQVMKGGDRAQENGATPFAGMRPRKKEQRTRKESLSGAAGNSHYPCDLSFLAIRKQTKKGNPKAPLLLVRLGTLRRSTRNGRSRSRDHVPGRCGRSCGCCPTQSGTCRATGEHSSYDSIRQRHQNRAFNPG